MAGRKENMLDNDVLTGKKTGGRKAGKPSRQPETDSNAPAAAGSAKKRGRPKGSKNKTVTVRKDRMPATEPGENTKFLSHDLKLLNLPDIDLNNPLQVKTRVNEYFSICAEDDTKPSIESFALSLHASRHDVFNWLNSRSHVIKNAESIRTIKTAYDIINSYYAHLMNTGRINPVAGIFMMKNNLGYKDSTEYTITSNENQDLNITDIADKAGLLTD